MELEFEIKELKHEEIKELKHEKEKLKRWAAA